VQGQKRKNELRASRQQTKNALASVPEEHQLLTDEHLAADAIPSEGRALVSEMTIGGQRVDRRALSANNAAEKQLMAGADR
jgi:hypothetical protein